MGRQANKRESWSGPRSKFRPKSATAKAEGPKPPPLPSNAKRALDDTARQETGSDQEERKVFLAVGPLDEQEAFVLVSQLASDGDDLRFLLWRKDAAKWDDSRFDTMTPEIVGESIIEEHRSEVTRRLDRPEIEAKVRDEVVLVESESPDKPDTPAMVKLGEIPEQEKVLVEQTRLKEVEQARRAAEEIELKRSRRHSTLPPDKRRDSSEQIHITGSFSRSLEDTCPRITVDARAHNRIRYQVSVTLASSSNFWTGLTQDISTGGIFVATYNILPLGTQFEVTFSLPDGRSTISSEAEVCWLREYRPGQEAPPGMGLRFLSLAEIDRRRIDKFVKDRDTIFFPE